eukprot:1488542-Rhodomonas_salina.1
MSRVAKRPTPATAPSCHQKCQHRVWTSRTITNIRSVHICEGRPEPSELIRVRRSWRPPRREHSIRSRASSAAVRPRSSAAPYAGSVPGIAYRACRQIAFTGRIYHGAGHKFFVLASKVNQRVNQLFRGQRVTAVHFGVSLGRLSKAPLLLGPFLPSQNQISFPALRPACALRASQNTQSCGEACGRALNFNEAAGEARRWKEEGRCKRCKEEQ